MDQVNQVSNDFVHEQFVDVLELVEMFEYVAEKEHLKVFLTNNIHLNELLEHDYMDLVELNSLVHYKMYAFYIQHVPKNSV
jgi:hypothetical protein